MITSRLATAEDHRAWFDRDPPEISTALVFERDGIPIALGMVQWDQWGRAWGSVDLKGKMPPFAGHRAAKRALAALRSVGVPELLAFCNPDHPRGAAWLLRLGFRLAPELDGDSKLPVWRCVLWTPSNG